MKIIILSILGIAMIGLMSPNAFSQTIPLTLILDPIPSNVYSDDTITFSGQLITADGQYFVGGETICIKDDVDFGTDTVIGCLETSNESGEFAGTWVATTRSDGGAYDFYAVFDGYADLGDARSSTYSVTVTTSTSESESISPPPPEPIPLTLLFDSVPTTVNDGDTITFSGQLITADGQYFVGGETVYIKDDVDFGTDTIIAVVTTSNNDGSFVASWTATPRYNGGTYDFYVIFEGDAELEPARSITYSVTVDVQTIPLKIVLDPITSNVYSGDTITFSGQLITADEQYFVGGETICIKEDVDFGTDTVIGCLETSNESGEFVVTWTAQSRNDGWSHQFYAVFDGSDDFESARSQTYSVKVNPIQKSSSYITLDPIVDIADLGTRIVLSGTLELENGNPAGKTVIIKDEDVLDVDDVLAKAIVGSDGRYQATWIVKDVDSNDRRMLKTLSNLSVPVVAPTVLTFLTGYENTTVEIFAVFEGDEASERTDTCVMKSFTVPNYDGTSMTKQSETKYCRNNQLVISDLDPTASGLLKSVIFSQLVGGVGIDSDLLTSFAGDGKINQSETLQLKDMLMGLDPIKEKTSGKSDMSLEEILNLIENPTSVIEDKIEEKISVIEEEIKEGVEDKIDDVIKESTTTSVTTIPGWVKNNAGWWADGQIPDSAFVQGIQYLIKEGIMVIPSTVQTATADSQEVPGWVKNNAGWWASGEIPDSTFVNGIQYLIKEGIIKVESVSMDDFGKVTRIVDGDTLLIDQTKIRLSLVNTPERGEPGFQEATDFTATTCPVGTNAKFIEDSLQPKDRYGRSVGLVYCNDMFLNELLLTNGHAKISTYYCDKSEFGNEDWARDHGC